MQLRAALGDHRGDGQASDGARRRRQGRGLLRRGPRRHPGQGQSERGKGESLTQNVQETFPELIQSPRFRVCNSRNLSLIFHHTQVVRDIWEESDDHGRCRFAVVQTYGDTTHTFVERSGYKGLFLPGELRQFLQPGS